MSETAAYQTRKPTRVRMLGDAVPTYREFRDDEEPKIVPKTADELRADREAARDAAPMAASCGVDGCTWAYTGTAGDCRVESATHRANAHPELAGRRTHSQTSPGSSKTHAPTSTAPTPAGSTPSAPSRRTPSSKGSPRKDVAA